MPGQPEISNLALFCDFENIALGVRDAKYANFDIRRVLERLLLKGSIVVKKAYCDWDRYKEFKRQMHEASFELIEIPHVRMSGKNSADIRMVVDALDLCYTKSHVDAFVIISGDSDFSPLVSKLRENNKHVIGIGVRDSTSDLLAANCDEFIFYDDLVRETKRPRARRPAAKTAATARSDSSARASDNGAVDVEESGGTGGKAARSGRSNRSARSALTEKADVVAAAANDAGPDDDGIADTGDAAATAGKTARKTTRTARGGRRSRSAKSDARSDEKGDAHAEANDAAGEDAVALESARGNADPGEDGSDDVNERDDDRRHEALDLLVETIEALAVERGDDEKLWGSMVKQTMKRRRPGFNESAYGYKSFRELVDDAAQRNLLIVVSDPRPGQYALRLPPG